MRMDDDKMMVQQREDEQKNFFICIKYTLHYNTTSMTFPFRLIIKAILLLHQRHERLSSETSGMELLHHCSSINVNLLWKLKEKKQKTSSSSFAF